MWGSGNDLILQWSNTRLLGWGASVQANLAGLLPTYHCRSE
jgi:hypothetical protein